MNEASYKKLLEGFERFRSYAYDGKDAPMHALIENGQAPEFFIISCIDSRSNAGMVFNTAPGTFFNHNAMGAIVRPYKHGTALAAALQFALEHNPTKEIIVLGHTGCGAIKALVEKIDDAEILSFVEVAKQGLERAQECCAGVCTHDEMLRHAEEQIVLLSAENLKTYPSIQKALDENRVTIRPWLFDMHEGRILAYSQKEKEFSPLSRD